MNHKNEFNEIRNIIKDIDDVNELFTALRDYPSIHHKNFCGNLLSYLIPIFKPYEHKYDLKEVIKITGVKDVVLYPLDIHDHMVDNGKFDRSLVKKSFLNALRLLDQYTKIDQSNIGDYLIKTLPFDQWISRFILYTFSDTSEYNNSSTSKDYEYYNFYGKSDDEIYKFILNFLQNPNNKKIEQLNRLYELNTTIDLDRVNTSIEMILKDLDFLIFYICNETVLTTIDPVYNFEMNFKGFYNQFISYMCNYEKRFSGKIGLFEKPFKYDSSSNYIYLGKAGEISKDFWNDCNSSPFYKFEYELQNIQIYDISIYKRFLQNFTGRKYIEVINPSVSYSVVAFTHFYYKGLKILEKLYENKDIVIQKKYSMNVEKMYDYLFKEKA